MGFKTAAWWFLFVLLFARTGWAGLERSEHAEIAVRVLNHAGIARSELIGAESEAARIFRAAGVEIRWVNCLSGGCYGTLGANEFVLNIVPDGKTSNDLVFGVAFLGPSGEGKFADVFFRRIEAACGSNRQNIWRMLATVAAHELGHLLLGSHAHSSAGIMMPIWAEGTVHRVEIGTLLFTSDQANLMRERIVGNGLLLAGGAKSSEDFSSREGLPVRPEDSYRRGWRTRSDDTR